MDRDGLAALCQPMRDVDLSLSSILPHNDVVGDIYIQTASSCSIYKSIDILRTEDAEPYNDGNAGIALKRRDVSENRSHQCRVCLHPPNAKPVKPGSNQVLLVHTIKQSLPPSNAFINSSHKKKSPLASPDQG